MSKTGNAVSAGGSGEVNNLGDVLRKTGQFRDGLAYSIKSLDLAKAHGERYQISSAFNDIAKAYNLLEPERQCFSITCR